jgi:hypothetical protein
MFYCVDKTTGKRTSLLTTDRDEAQQIIEAKNQAERQPVLNLQIARAYLTASDPAWTQRNWQDVANRIQTHGKESTQSRYVRAMKSKVFDPLRAKKLLETTAEDFLTVLNDGKVFTTSRRISAGSPSRCWRLVFGPSRTPNHGEESRWRNINSY